MGENGYNGGDSGRGPAETGPAPDLEPVNGDDMAHGSSKSTKFAAFQFYPRDFLASDKVARMSLSEIGVYITLLSYAWLGRGLPTDIDQLARLVRIPPKRFAKIWSGVLSECFVVKGGKLVNPRQELQRKELESYVASCAKGGERSAETRKARYGSAQPPRSDPRSGPRSDAEVTPNTASASSTASSTAKKSTDGARRIPTLVTPPIQHRNVAHFSPCGDVPNFVHDELVRKVANGGVGEREADQQVRAFYADTERRFEGQIVGDPAPKFWRDQFAQRAKPTKPMSDAAATVFKTLGVKL